MRRRDFLGILGGAATWPATAVSQQASLQKIGFLSSSSEKEWAPLVSSFSKGLGEADYLEGRNVTIDYRWADGQYDRLPALAAELLRAGSNVIVAVAPPAARAAKAATTTVPIAFVSGADPVALGLVSSMNRPGGNLTGITFATAELSSKTLQTVHQLVPKIRSAALLVNPKNPNSASQSRDMQIASQKFGSNIHVLPASSEIEIDKAFDRIKELGIDALIIATDAYFLVQKRQIVALAQHHAVPTIYNLREYVVSGGLLSYGTSVTDAYRQLGAYVSRILRGAKPSELPILQPTKFELVINRKTAAALNIAVPDTLIALADEVIE